MNLRKFLTRNWKIITFDVIALSVLMIMFISKGCSFYGTGWVVWQFLLLFIGYTLIWFLTTCSLFVITVGFFPSLRMETAAVLGLFSAVLHCIVCHFISNTCNL